MNTQQTQVILNLPLDLKKLAESKAQKLGMSLEEYIKHLIIRDVEE